ncbi:hypothetical protein [Sphingomicrobium lutaoense]|uniref:C-type lysozyme inhibitor domain-containing protein n=1 Tax=Sphingomicrobium lutaoense TaxID=515949 RepID=A0A839Z1D3_9SPHN|nr:hypothetical protein [Sphingomicrobium lutaoense]MBB3764368.1 hypothetical protein [Sphingomicrobium lutaoense]
MKKNVLSFCIAATAILGACGQNDEPDVVGGPADPMANQLANAEPIGPIPVMVGSEDYRCADNSLVQVDFIQTGEENSVRVTPEGEAGVTAVEGEEAGTFTGEGVTVKGAPSDASITYNGQTCKR